MTSKIQNKPGLQLLGVGASLFAFGAGSEANASCVINGSGTITALGANAGVSCTFSTSVLSISSNNAGAYVILGENATLASAGSGVTLGGTNSTRVRQRGRISHAVFVR